MKVAKAIVPFLVAVVYVFILYMALPYDQLVTMLAAMGGYLFPPLGKESMIPFAIANYVPWPVVVVSIAMVDVILALLVMWNYDHVLRIPFIGPKLEALAERGRGVIVKKDWLKKLSYAGIALFVMVPFEGSGGLTASIIGRMLGMEKRRVFLSVCAGALVGVFLIARFSAYIVEAFDENVRIIGGMIAGVVVLSVIVTLWRGKKKSEPEQ